MLLLLLNMHIRESYEIKYTLNKIILMLKLTIDRFASICRHTSILQKKIAKNVIIEPSFSMN